MVATDALWIPRQVVVHNQAAELKVDTLSGRFRSYENTCLISEFLNYRRFHIGLP
jgi:hypothetical protein